MELGAYGPRTPNEQRILARLATTLEGDPKIMEDATTGAFPNLLELVRDVDGWVPLVVSSRLSPAGKLVGG